MLVNIKNNLMLSFIHICAYILNSHRKMIFKKLKNPRIHRAKCHSSFVSQPVYLTSQLLLYLRFLWPRVIILSISSALFTT